MVARRGILSCSPIAEALLPARTDGLGAAPREVEETTEHAVAVGTDAVVLVLVGNPRPKTPDLCRRLLGEGSFDVHVLGVDRGGGRDLVGTQDIVVVQARPFPVGQQ